MIFHMPACSGCGNCSMACSFHNEGEFAPAKAAIRSLEKDDGQGYLISFSEESDEERVACNGCKECVKLCVPGEDLENIIMEYVLRPEMKFRQCLENAIAKKYHKEKLA